jgi:predicted DsbA family dithiol-disulfide isomerase
VRIEQLRREFNLKLRWTVFPLHPDTPEAGLELAELFAGRGYDLEAMATRLRSVAAEVGLSLGERSRTYNSRRAQELGKWAEEQGRGDAFHAAAYHAYFVEGRNLAETDELVAIADAAGLSGSLARIALGQERFGAAVDADWERARTLGVTAVPTLIYNGRSLVGFQDYPAFRRLITG